jgi:hypothetical protein
MYAPVSAAVLRVGNDITAFAPTNGAGPTTQLVTDLGTLSSALGTAQQAATGGVDKLSPSAAGYSQLSAFANALPRSRP